MQDLLWQKPCCVHEYCSKRQMAFLISFMRHGLIRALGLHLDLHNSFLFWQDFTALVNSWLPITTVFLFRLSFISISALAKWLDCGPWRQKTEHGDSSFVFPWTLEAFKRLNLQLDLDIYQMSVWQNSFLEWHIPTLDSARLCLVGLVCGKR